jgi:hypothetical protein
MCNALFFKPHFCLLRAALCALGACQVGLRMFRFSPSVISLQASVEAASEAARRKRMTITVWEMQGTRHQASRHASHHHGFMQATCHMPLCKPPPCLLSSHPHAFVQATSMPSCKPLRCPNACPLASHMRHPMQTTTRTSCKPPGPH